MYKLKGEIKENFRKGSKLTIRLPNAIKKLPCGSEVWGIDNKEKIDPAEVVPFYKFLLGMNKHACKQQREALARNYDSISMITISISNTKG